MPPEAPVISTTRDAKSSLRSNLVCTVLFRWQFDGLPAAFRGQVTF
jgi:hypothetical protein